MELEGRISISMDNSRYHPPCIDFSIPLIRNTFGSTSSEILTRLFQQAREVMAPSTLEMCSGRSLEHGVSKLPVAKLVRSPDCA